MGRLTTLQERTIDVAGLAIRILDAGKGDPPIVFLHGLGATATKWRDVLPLVGMQSRAIAPDLPGFGRSGVPRARYTIGWLAGGVRSTLDALGIVRAHIVGNSLGGMVALWLAGAWPDRVASLVLAGAAFPTVRGQRHDPVVLARFAAPLVPGLGEAMYTTYTHRRTPEVIVDEGLAVNCADASRVSKETRDLLVEEAAARRTRPELRRAMLSAQRSLAWMITAKREEVRRVANGLLMPTLLLWGERDRFVPPAVAHEWVGEIPGAELIVLEGAGHNPQLEVPDRVAQVVLAFTQRADLAAR